MVNDRSHPLSHGDALMQVAHRLLANEPRPKILLLSGLTTGHMVNDFYSMVLPRRFYCRMAHRALGWDDPHTLLRFNGHNAG